MRRLLLGSVVALAAAVLLPLAAGPLPAGAGEVATTDAYLVHGINADLQDAQDDGGTPVTVCADGATLVADFQFGDVMGPEPLPTGEPVLVEVYDGAGQDCADPEGDPLIEQEVTPEGAAVALVASFESSGALEGRLLLVPFTLDVECVPAGEGRLTAAHAAAAPPVEVTVDGELVGELAFGQSATDDLPAAAYAVEVLLGDAPIVDEDVTVAEALHTAVLVVGNLPSQGPTSPVVPLALTIPLEPCEVPTTPTTATPTSATPAPAAAQPRFTG